MTTVSSYVKDTSDGYPMSKWRKERIWIEAVEGEAKSVKKWDENWSFTLDYDSKVFHYLLF
jgi:hypothetical protein